MLDTGTEKGRKRVELKPRGEMMLTMTFDASFFWAFSLALG